MPSAYQVRGGGRDFLSNSAGFRTADRPASERKIEGGRAIDYET
jgi:hypothetical protein